MESNSSNKRRTKSGALMLMVSLITSTAIAQSKATASTDGDITSSQEIINHKVFQVNKIKVDAPPEAVWAVLTDYEDAPRVYSKVSTCHVVQNDGAKKLVAFKVRAFKDLITLDYILNIQEHFPKSIEWSRNSGAFKANEGYWHMDPTDGGKRCLVTYAKFIDGGPMQYFINKELKLDMPVILGSVKSSAEKFYQNGAQEKIAKHQERTMNSTKNSSLPECESVTEVTTITLHGMPKSGL